MSPAEWLHKIANLNVYRARHGVAPHKALLLLVLCDLADEGLLPGLKLDLTPPLAFRFFSYWTIVALSTYVAVFRAVAATASLRAGDAG